MLFHSYFVLLAIQQGGTLWGKSTCRYWYFYSVLMSHCAAPGVAVNVTIELSLSLAKLL